MICPLCNRELIKPDKHHLIPKLKGGKNGDTVDLHRICHEKIHSIWTESELRDFYHTIDRIKTHEDIQKFIKWVAKKPSDFYSPMKMANRKR